MIVEYKSTVEEKLNVPPEIANACWIWTDQDPDENDVWVYARRSFSVNDPAGAKFHLTADLRYLVWVNGSILGFGPAKSHIDSPSLDTYSIEHLLHPGQNSVCVLVYSFGANGHITALMPRRGAMIGSIDCDGKIIPTDSSWRVSREYAYRQTGVRINEHQPYIEQFDARMSLANPWLSDYDDAQWSFATELSGPIYDPWHCIVRRDIPLMRVESRSPERLIEWGVAGYASPVEEIATEHLAEQIAQADRGPANSGEVIVAPGHYGTQDIVQFDASRVPEDAGCYAIFDFGRVWTGNIVVTFQGDPGTVVDLSYCEGLTDGTVDPSKQNGTYCDRIVLGHGPLTHRILLPKSLRYVQFDVRGGSAVISNVELEASTYPVQRSGSFHSSDAVLNQAWEISAHTVQLCMEDSYMDTPWRERGAWLGDVIPEVHANYYAYGDKHLMRRFLIQHSLGQSERGSLLGKYPGKSSSHVHTWNLTYAFALLHYFRHTGDSDLVIDLWPTIKGVAGWLESYHTHEGLYGNFPLNVTFDTNVYTFIDWAPVDTSGTNAAFNAFAYAFWNACAELASIVGDSNAQSRYENNGRGLKERFTQLFWNDQEQVFANGRKDGQLIDRFGIHENMLAVLFRIATPKQLQAITDRFDKDTVLEVFKADSECYEGLLGMAIALNRYPWPSTVPVPVGTPYFAYWMLQGLCELGQVELALNFIRKHWGEISRCGGTTVWEHWTDEGSLSHAWSAAPVIIAGKYILGAAPSNLNPSVWNVFPNRADLTRAKGRIPTPNGVLGISWTWKGFWRVELVVPNGLTVALGLPAAEASNIRIDDRIAERSELLELHSERRIGVRLTGGNYVITAGDSI